MKRSIFLLTMVALMAATLTMAPQGPRGVLVAHADSSPILNFAGGNQHKSESTYTGGIGIPGFFPAMAHAAPGDTEVIQYAEDSIYIYNKSTQALIKQCHTGDIFGNSTFQYPVNGRVIYDPTGTRFILQTLFSYNPIGTGTGTNQGVVWYAVSKSHAPTTCGSSDWYIYHMDFNLTGSGLNVSNHYLVDIPHLGADFGYGLLMGAAPIYNNSGAISGTTPQAYDYGTPTDINALWVLNLSTLEAGTGPGTITPNYVTCPIDPNNGAQTFCTFDTPVGWNAVGTTSTGPYYDEVFFSYAVINSGTQNIYTVHYSNTSGTYPGTWGSLGSSLANTVNYPENTAPSVEPSACNDQNGNAPTIVALNGANSQIEGTTMNYVADSGGTNYTTHYWFANDLGNSAGTSRWVKWYDFAETVSGVSWYQGGNGPVGSMNGSIAGIGGHSSYGTSSATGTMVFEYLKSDSSNYPQIVVAKHESTDATSVMDTYPTAIAGGSTCLVGDPINFYLLLNDANNDITCSGTTCTCNMNNPQCWSGQRVGDYSGMAVDWSGSNNNFFWGSNEYPCSQSDGLGGQGEPHNGWCTAIFEITTP